MSYPAMTATVTERTATTATITVEHDIRQSYSKAVQPRAMKEARRNLRDGVWALAEVDYDMDTVGSRTSALYSFVRQS